MGIFYLNTYNIIKNILLPNYNTAIGSNISYFIMQLKKDLKNLRLRASLQFIYLAKAYG